MNDVTSGNAAASHNAITSGTSSGSNAAKATTRNAVKKAPVKRRTPMTAYGKRQQSIWGPKVKSFKPSKHRSTASIPQSIYETDAQGIGSKKFSITQRTRVFSFLIWLSLDLSEKLQKSINSTPSFKQQCSLHYKRSQNLL